MTVHCGETEEQIESSFVRSFARPIASLGGLRPPLTPPPPPRRHTHRDAVLAERGVENPVPPELLQQVLRTPEDAAESHVLPEHDRGAIGPHRRSHRRVDGREEIQAGRRTERRVVGLVDDGGGGGGGKGREGSRSTMSLTSSRGRSRCSRSGGGRCLSAAEE